MTGLWRSLGLVACALVALAAPAFAQDDGLALRVKATYLYKFAPFVEWPASARLEEAQTFDICIVGHDPFGRTLDAAVRGQRLHGKPARVRRFPSASGDAGGCRIMYIGGSRTQSIAEALAATHSFPVLTVTDDARMKDAQGVVHFVEIQGKIKFQIDNLLAEEKQLVISSQLLELATAVRAARPGAAPDGAAPDGAGEQ